ncbi:hypothetical protein HpNP49_09170 [Helicobacter pylori]
MAWWWGALCGWLWYGGGYGSAKLNEKALDLMRKQIDALENGQESGNYSLSGIRSRQAQLEDLGDDKTS